MGPGSPSSSLLPSLAFPSKPSPFLCDSTEPLSTKALQWLHQIGTSISSLLNLNQIIFLKYNATNTEAHRMCRVRNVGALRPKWMSSSNPSPQVSGIHEEEEAERLKETEVIEECKETLFSRHNRTDAHRKSHKEIKTRCLRTERQKWAMGYQP